MSQPTEDQWRRALAMWGRSFDLVDLAKLLAIHQAKVAELEAEVARLERVCKAVAPFAEVAAGIPDNWPGQCRLRIDHRLDGSEYLAYHGVSKEPLGALPFICEWRAAAEAAKEEG